ncbi:NACHT domain-containing protein [Acetobacterium wieringae]|uniref:NACHT domain-containing protein n=1 Tax=Acetobacterium wieringae TaxID=52694 RepID=UPI0031590F22
MNISITADKLLSKLFGEAKNINEKMKIDLNISFKKYLQKSYDKYSQIRTIIYKPEPRYLYDFFECNFLKHNNSEINACDVNNLLDISNFLVVEGTGGIGKSTMMKHLFLDEISKSDLIPIFIELKDINIQKSTFFDFIYSTINILGINFEEEYFKYALENGCFLLLFDGYDEVTSERSSILINDIRDFCDRYPKNYYIVSSRPNNISSCLDRFSLLEMVPLSKEQAVNLIKKIDYDLTCKTNFIEQLRSNLYEKNQSF